MASTKVKGQNKAEPKSTAPEVKPTEQPNLEKKSQQLPKDDPEFVEACRKEEEQITQWMIEHPREVIKERKKFMQQLIKRRCSYGSQGGILPITLSPLFLKQESLDLVAHVGEVLDRALDKVALAFAHDPYVRSYFLYPDIPKEWLDWDPGYKKPTVLNRHDALFDGKNLKFIEFNTDNPGGRGWLDATEEIFREYPIYKDLLAKYAKPFDRDMLRELKSSLLTCYQEYGGKKQNPRVALVSFKQFLPGSDNEIVRDYLVENGLDTHFIDAREFEYRNGRLYSNKVDFDILNITLRFTFFKRFPKEMKDFLDAIRDRAVCSINPFRAAVCGQKEVMSFMTNEENHAYFTEEEAQYIKKYIPWTRRMDETITISKEGTDIALQEYAIKHKDELVLKPTWAAGGYEVYVGKVTEKDKWADAIGESIGCPWWIIQEAVEIPAYDFPVLKNNQIVMEKKHLNINPYIFHGKYVGCLGRISESKVINVSSGGGIIPIFGLKSSADEPK